MCTPSSCGSRWMSHTAPCWCTCATRSGTTTSTVLSAPRRTACRGFVRCSATPTPTIRYGAPPGWKKDYGSSYATMHPAEDWAETFAHYLHIRDTLDTAAAFGFAPSGATFERRGLGRSGFDTIIEMWLPLAWALNMVNRSMGRDDLYPFVLPAVVLDKMRFIRTVIDEMACDPAKLADRQPGIARGVMAEPMHLGPPTSIGSRRGPASRRQRSNSSPRRAYARAAMKAVADGACQYLAPQHRPGDSSGRSEGVLNA